MTITSTSMRLFSQVLTLLSLCQLALGDTPVKTDPSDSITPKALLPGAPLGVYDLNSWESVNVYNGRLNVRFKLLTVGGRGEAGYTITVETGLPPWTIETTNGVVPGAAQGMNNFYFSTRPNAKFWYEGAKVGYGAGLMFVKYTAAGSLAPCGSDPVYTQTFTHLVFVDSEGTEHTFYDTASPTTKSPGCIGENGASRGNRFQTTDGSGMVFTSTDTISDKYLASSYPAAEVAFVSGSLIARSGKTYTIVDGMVTKIKDRNGNLVTLVPVAGTRIPQTITDSMGRSISIEYDKAVIGEADTTYDQLTYTGYSNSARTIKVYKKYLAYDPDPNVGTLRPVWGNTDSLFPQMHIPVVLKASNNASALNAKVVSKVELPNGNSYKIWYTQYGEPSRVLLPTGAAIDYEHAAGLRNADNSIGRFTSGQVNADIYGCSLINVPQSQPVVAPYATYIYRRLVSRKVFNTGIPPVSNPPAPDQTTTYSLPEIGNALTITGCSGQYTVAPSDGYVEVVESGSNVATKTTLHYFHNIVNQLNQTAWGGVNSGSGPASEIDSTGTTSRISLEPKDAVGREYRAEVVGFRRTETLYKQLPGMGVVPCQEDTFILDGASASNAAKRSSKRFEHDSNGNRTEAYEWAFDAGTAITGQDFPFSSPVACATPAPSNFTRRVSSTYQTSTDYVNDSVHLISLIESEKVFDGSNSLKSQTSYLYDQYNSTSGLATLLVRSSPIQYQAPSDFRGNITSITKTVSRVTGTGAGAQSDVVVKRAYDSLGNIVKTKDARGCETSISYDTAAFALVTEIKKCAVNAVELALQYENDFNIGKPTLVVAPNKVRTKVEYGDTLDRITKISYGVNALNTTSKAVTIFNYGDTPGSLYVRTSNDQFAANDSKLKSEVQFDNLGRETLLCTGNYCAGTSPTAIQVSKEYNGFGQNRKVSNPGSGTPSADKTTTSYDVLGRPISVCHPDAACDTNEYSLETILEDVAGKQRKTAIDAFGRLVSVIEAPSDTTMQYFTGYGYDVFNNLISVLQKKKIGDNSSDLSRTFNHDSLGRLLDATNPERSPMFFSYDPNGNVLTVQDSRVIVTNTLDDLNRVVTKSYSDGATPQARYCYDGFYFLNGLCTGAAVESSAGAQTAYGNAISSTRFSHDSFGRVSSSQQTTGGVSPSIDYSYYADNSLASQVLGARTQTTCYDQLGRSLWVSLSLTSTDCKIGTSATSTNTVARATQFADHGAIKELIFANGLRENWCFNNRLQGTGLHLGVTASTDCSFVSGEVFGLGLEFTSGSQSLNNGNVMAQVIRMRPNDASTNQIRLRQTYTYDNVNRIASAVEIAEVGSTGSGWSMNWAYDHRGNMWVSSHNTPLTVGTPEKLTWYDQTRNQLSYISDTQNAGTRNFYDLSGNLTSRPKEVGAGVDTFTYDGENRINTVNGAATYYQYDSVGKRVVTQTASPSQTVTFIYNAFGQLVREYGSSIQNSGYSYLTQDNLGSTRVITSPTGNVLARMDYEPFGRELTSGSATARRTPLPDGTFTSITGFGGLSAFKQRFTGKERDDETGLDYFGARYMSSAQGRFTSPDRPFADQHPADPQSWNLYSYVRNNPLRLVDDDGMKVNEAAVARAQEQIKATVASGGSTMTFVFLGINSGEARFASTATAQAIPEFSGMFGLGNLDTSSGGNTAVLPNENFIMNAFLGQNAVDQLDTANAIAPMARGAGLGIDMVTHSNGVNSGGQFAAQNQLGASVVIAPNTASTGTMSNIVNASQQTTIISSPRDNRLAVAPLASKSPSAWQRIFGSKVSVVQTNQRGHGAQCYGAEVQGQDSTQVAGCK